MLSFNKWKKLNEHTTVLGLGQKTTVGGLHNRWDEAKSKKMLGDAPEGDMPPMPMKKKKPMGPMPPLEDEDPEEDTGDMEGEDDFEDVDDTGEEGDMDSDGEEGDEEGDMSGEDMGGEDMPPPEEPPMPVKKKPKHGFLDKTQNVVDGAKMMHKGASKMAKYMKEEKDREFWKSLKAQTGTTKFVKDELDRIFVPVEEDTIIPPSNPNAGIVADEPGPGEPGFAPQGKVGQLGSFTEWSSKHKKKK